MRAAGRRPPLWLLGHADVIVPLRPKAGDTVLSFISTMTVSGAPQDITLSELALET